MGCTIDNARTQKKERNELQLSLERSQARFDRQAAKLQEALKVMCTCDIRGFS